VLLAPLVAVGTLLLPLGSPAGATLPASEATFASPAESLGEVGSTLPTGGTATGSGARAAHAAATQDLDVSLDELTPSVLPKSGPVTMRGTVTNTTEDTLTDVNVHPLTSYSPMTSAREIEVSVESDPEAYIGSRIITSGLFDSVGDLAPGQTAGWRVRIPVTELQISGEEGVYWIGVQVLGADETGAREIHGRARSFIPLMQGKQEAVPTSVILPVRRPVLRTAEGRVTRADEWAGDLDPGGRLSNLAAFVRSSGTAPVTWLIDPAVLDAVDQLARGNPRRSLEPTQPAPGENDAEQQADEADAQAAEADANGLPEAARWLQDVQSLTARNPVLALPYGDLDVAAAARYAPSLYNQARSISNEVLGELKIESTPAVVPPSGLINPAGLGLTPFDTEIFLSDEALPITYDDPADVPPVVESGGRRVGITDHGVAVGGPGPDDRNGMVALRQRVLAEAAVRSLGGDVSDLVVDLPFDFDPGTGSGVFFDGLEQPFLEMVPAGVPRNGEVPTVDKVEYPTRQVVRELNEANFTSALRFENAGTRLDNILVRNDEIADEVLREALCTVSYMHRDNPVAAQVSADASAAWLQARLLKVRIEAPSFVLLSSNKGPFAVTVTNDLDQPVRIRIKAQTRDDLVIRAPERIDLEAETRQTVDLTAEAGSIGVHPVRLVATDEDGQPTGSFDEIDIRSNTVGKIIWVIMGIGVGILAISIPVRWARKRRRAEAEA
jgi:hypothetical protein